jgi:fructosamine-3-kinase
VSPGGQVAQRLERLTGAGVRDLRPAGAAHQWHYYRASLADGRAVFAKVAAAGAGGVFGAEARGLRWLAEADAVPVPEVVGWDEQTLVVSWVDPGPPGTVAAERFGRQLARLHGSGAATFGAPWPGFIAGLAMPNDSCEQPGPAGAPPSWPDWYAEYRVLPYLRMAVDAETLAVADAGLVEAAAARAGGLAGPAEPPSRIHGDLWSGNILWSAGTGWLIDPAAHGGHRETDLAMLALFGAPHLDRILAAYREQAPLPAGWSQRVPLHQLHPLLVHVCLFGAAYTEPVLTAARAVLAA